MRNKHHRKCKSNGGTNSKENISMVKMTEHRAFHFLFRNCNAYGIAEILNKTWIDPDYEIIVRKK